MRKVEEARKVSRTQDASQQSLTADGRVQGVRLRSVAAEVSIDVRVTVCLILTPESQLLMRVPCD